SLRLEQASSSPSSSPRLRSHVHRRRRTRRSQMHEQSDYDEDTEATPRVSQSGFGPTPAEPARVRGARLTRARGFAALCSACVLVAGGYTALASRRAGVALRRPTLASVAAPGAVDELARRPHVLFRSLGQGDAFGRIALAPLDVPGDAPRAFTALGCERVHFAAGHG